MRFKKRRRRACAASTIASRGGVFSPNASSEGNKSDAFERFVDERDGVRRSARACVRRAAT
jgi:hypothetical protein